MASETERREEFEWDGAPRGICTKCGKFYEETVEHEGKDVREPVEQHRFTTVPAAETNPDRTDITAEDKADIVGNSSRNVAAWIVGYTFAGGGEKVMNTLTEIIAAIRTDERREVWAEAAEMVRKPPFPLTPNLALVMNELADSMVSRAEDDAS